MIESGWGITRSTRLEEYGSDCRVSKSVTTSDQAGSSCGTSCYSPPSLVLSLMFQAKEKLGKESLTKKQTWYTDPRWCELNFSDFRFAGWTYVFLLNYQSCRTQEGTIAKPLRLALPIVSISSDDVARWHIDWRKSGPGQPQAHLPPLRVI